MINKKNSSFVEFYEKHKVSPVKQNISKLKNHFCRRRFLLYKLKITKKIIQTSSILEFGPGSGYNSLYLAYLKPRKYVLVDGNSTALNEVKVLFNKHRFKMPTLKNKLFLDFKIKNKFDIVWAEGCIQHQVNPQKILLHLSRFTAREGIFACSTLNGISWLSEMLRRCIYNTKEIPNEMPLKNILDIIRPYFLPHLYHLPQMSRLYDDWIIDNIIQPLDNRKLLSVPACLSKIQNKFDIMGSLPEISNDWRWYKSVIQDDMQNNYHFLENYYCRNVLLIDKKLRCSVSHTSKFGRYLEKMGESSWTKLCLYEKSKERRDLDKFLQEVHNIAEEITKISPTTSDSIFYAIDYIKKGAPKFNIPKQFLSWWGRGQQYLSFIKK